MTRVLLRGFSWRLFALTLAMTGPACFLVFVYALAADACMPGRVESTASAIYPMIFWLPEALRQTRIAHRGFTTPWVASMALTPVFWAVVLERLLAALHRCGVIRRTSESEPLVDREPEREAARSSRHGRIFGAIYASVALVHAGLIGWILYVTHWLREAGWLGFCIVWYLVLAFAIATIACVRSFVRRASDRV